MTSLWIDKYRPNTLAKLTSACLPFGEKITDALCPEQATGVGGLCANVTEERRTAGQVHTDYNTTLQYNNTLHHTTLQRRYHQQVVVVRGGG
jgi:hypothetical protein